MASPDTVSSIKHPRYFTSENCLICISPCFMLSFLMFFILNLTAQSTDFVLSTPKWKLSLLPTNQSHILQKSTFNCFIKYYFTVSAATMKNWLVVSFSASNNKSKAFNKRK